MQPHLARAARALLGLTQAELAQRAGVSLRTVIAYESNRAMHSASVQVIRAALETSGICFRPDGSITTAEAVMDAFAAIKNPTAAQKAEYAVACYHVAQAGGRRPHMSEGAKSIVAAYEKSLGLRKDDQ